MKDALLVLEKKMPFPLRAICSDNGTEFLNHDVLKAFVKNRENPVSLFRGRPYRKNDQAYVEQKNYTNVRQVFGYERIETGAALDLMNKIYEESWNELQNLYVPQKKTLHKERHGSKMKGIQSKPLTPADRLMDEDSLSMEEKGELAARKLETSPFVLKERLKTLMQKFAKLHSSNTNPRNSIGMS